MHSKIATISDDNSSLNGWSFIISNGKKSDSFAAHFVQHFNATTPDNDLRKYMTFKVVKQINPIGAMKTFTKTNCNICIQERLTILKKLCDKRVTVMKKNLNNPVGAIDGQS